MKNLLHRLFFAIKAAFQLGFPQTFWYAVYQTGIRSGFFRRASPTGTYAMLSLPIQPIFHIPDKAQLSALLETQPGLVEDAVAEADEITAGQARLFGGRPVAICLRPPDSSRHWTFYETHPVAKNLEDIKFIWEPARFGWVYPLGRAYLLTSDERYPQAFWDLLEAFRAANPPNCGPNWSSAQEVALRLMAFLFAGQVFETSQHSSPTRRDQLAGMIAAHAQRIPLTLSYARAQNNNHLISEALGLYAAGCTLPGHPMANDWKKTGWHWLNRALQGQIQPDGVYTQQSMNYHRLMLHAALQAALLGRPLQELTMQRLASATTWLLAQIDPASGRAPNLGSNDGACILPLSAGGFADFRPVAQAAARAFLRQPAFPPGAWDELGLWLGQDFQLGQPGLPFPPCPAVPRLGNPSTWATLRAERFNQRPAHADQLHVDLWWKGENIALDAGTFRYTAAQPWDNALAGTAIHNTVTVDCQDQMLRAGRFLWLDWAQADRLDLRETLAETLAARHNGYSGLGIIHQRELRRISPGCWQVTDILLPARTFRIFAQRPAVHQFSLQWLLPDWPWSLTGSTLSLRHPAGGKVCLILSNSPSEGSRAANPDLLLIKGGVVLAGQGPAAPVMGWQSPTYNQRIPALSLSLTINSASPVTFVSDWILEEEDLSLEPDG